MSDVHFTRTWEDRSDHQGFRFEFRCERCHAGYGSAVIPGDPRQPGAREQALSSAAEQVGRTFGGCPVCRTWVCGTNCWNHAAGACYGCRPAAQAQPQPQPQPQPQAPAQPVSAVPPAAQQPPAVPQAQAEPQRPAAAYPQTQAWSADMGAELKAMLRDDDEPAAQRAKFCTQCGASLGGKFCGQCGTPAA